MKTSFSWLRKMRALHATEREAKARFGAGEYGRGESYVGITKPVMWRTRPARPDPCGRRETRRRANGSKSKRG